MDVIIGAAFGDEGKGLLTHYVASAYGQEAMVVRFNGGAQAGHTVVTNQLKRHVFRHFGSGTFAGATTFLSRFFVSNPILFLKEIEELHHLGLRPNVYVDPDSLLTTPYDMMINQIAEEYRGSQRHGSCGVGFAETIERNALETFSLKVADLENLPKVTDTLRSIRGTWLPQRLQALNVLSISEEWQRYIASDDILELYIHDLSAFLNFITVTRIDLTRSTHPIIFEGAQGLMLDQERGWFPHVTRSYTGLKNVIELIKGTACRLNVIYVTRCYLTRHGAGPLPYEVTHLPYQGIVDPTNVSNTYQGPLRYAWFNLSLLKSFIQADLKAAGESIPINHQLAVTCFDQADDQITFVDNDTLCKASQPLFLQRLAKEVAVSQILCSYGPTANAIEKIAVQSLCASPVA